MTCSGSELPDHPARVSIIDKVAVAPGVVFDLRDYPNSNDDILSYLIAGPAHFNGGMFDQLAVAAGLLDAITDMALDQAASVPLVARTVERANQAVAAWSRWRDDHPPKASA